MKIKYVKGVSILLLSLKTVTFRQITHFRDKA